MQKGLSDTSELPGLLQAAGGLISEPLPAKKPPRKGLRGSLTELLTPQQPEPLP